MLIYVNSLGGTVACLDGVTPTTTVGEVKQLATQQLFARQGHKATFGRLLHSGRELVEDSASLEAADIQEGDSLTLLAKWPTLLATGHPDGYLHVFNTEAAEVVAWRFGEAVRGIAWCDDGQYIAAASNFSEDVCRVGIFLAASGQQEQSFSMGGYVTAFACSPDGSELAVGGWGTLKLFCRASPERDPVDLQCGTLPSEALTSLAWSPDGACLAVGGGSGRVSIFAVDSRRTLWECNLRHVVYAVAWSPDGTQLAAAAGEPGQDAGRVTVKAAACGACLRSWRLAAKTLSVSWSPDGTRLAVATGHLRPRSGSVHVFSLASADGAEAERSWKLGDCVRSVAWSPDGDRLAVCAEDRSLRVLLVASGEEERHWDFPCAARSVAWAPV